MAQTDHDKVGGFSIGVGHTFDFVCGSVRPCRLLEVGCGDGALAALLVEAGFQVTAIDADPNVVVRARELGVSAVCADFIKYTSPAVEAILFSRSLHHMPDPKDAVRHARSLLQPKGTLLVEDFDRELVDAAAATWLFDVMSVAAEVCGVPFGPVEAPVETWCADHPKDHIRPARELNLAIRESFQVVQHHAVPYLYRYVADLVGCGSTARRLVTSIKRLESRLIERGSFPAVGQRWCCKA
ncbi:MAG: class I SAM-dependent methyltransferase [Acidobacteria bacterium]|nr:class I SAM-dependent methyltransferase [Acidobacteriota bacterium]